MAEKLYEKWWKKLSFEEQFTITQFINQSAYRLVDDFKKLAYNLFSKSLK